MGGWDVARATRSKKDVHTRAARTREKEERGLRERANEWRMNGAETEQGMSRVGHGVVGGWRDTVNRWEAINFGLECPIAPHFVQCKFTADTNRLVFSVLFRRENFNWETNVMPYQQDNSFLRNVFHDASLAHEGRKK